MLQTIHDWMLSIGVLCLVIVDVVILTIYTVVDRNRLAASSVPSGENAQDLEGVSLAKE